MTVEPSCIKAFHCNPLAKKCHVFPRRSRNCLVQPQDSAPAPTTARGISTFPSAQRILPLPQGFPPLHINCTTVSFKFCPTPLGFPTRCHNPPSGHRALQDLLTLATGFPVLLKLLCLPQKHLCKCLVESASWEIPPRRARYKWPKYEEHFLSSHLTLLALKRRKQR